MRTKQEQDFKDVYDQKLFHLKVTKVVPWFPQENKVELTFEIIETGLTVSTLVELEG